MNTSDRPYGRIARSIATVSAPRSRESLPHSARRRHACTYVCHRRDRTCIPIQPETWMEFSIQQMRTAGGGCAGCSSCEPARGGPPVRVAWNACDLEAAASVRRGSVVVAAGAAHDVLAIAESDVAAGERRRRTLLRGLGILAVDADGGVAFGE